MLKATKTTCERLAVGCRRLSARAHQVERPHLDDYGASFSGEIPSIDCDTKCFVGVARVVRQTGEVIEALGLAGFIAT